MKQQWKLRQRSYKLRAVILNRLNNRSRANGNRNLDNDNAHLVGIAQAITGIILWATMNYLANYVLMRILS